MVDGTLGAGAAQPEWIRLDRYDIEDNTFHHQWQSAKLIKSKMIQEPSKLPPLERVQLRC